MASFKSCRYFTSVYLATHLCISALQLVYFQRQKGTKQNVQYTPKGIATTCIQRMNAFCVHSLSECRHTYARKMVRAGALVTLVLCL